MTLRILPDLEQGSPEWHDQRRGMVTASVVGQLVTPTLKVASNDYSRGLTATLAAERITGFTEPTYMNADMWRGREDEPQARETYALHFDTPVAEVGFLVEDKWGFSIGFSPDGLVGDDGLIEIKSRRGKKQVQTVLSKSVPPENYLQVQCGLLVSGRDWLDYVSFCGGMHLWVTRVYPDTQAHAAIVDAVTQFESNVEQMVSDYLAGVAGFPMTERLELVVI